MNQLKEEDIIKEVNSLVGDEYTFLRIEKIPNRPNKVVLLHNKCQHEYHVEMSKFRKGNRCPCNFNSDNKRMANLEDFEREMKELKGDAYSICPDSKFLGLKKPITVKHNVCGNLYTTTPYEFLRRKRENGKIGCECSYCNQYGKARLYTFDQMNNIIKNIDDTYKLIDRTTYKNTLTKTKMLHTTCGTTYMVKPNDFLNGHRCPHCMASNKTSKGEDEIIDYIQNDLHIPVCKDKESIYPYHLDIYVPSKHIAFEYDGLYWHSIQALSQTKKHISPILYHLYKKEEAAKKGI